MKIWPFFRRSNSPRSGLSLNSQDMGALLHALEERLQAVEQDLAEQQRSLEEGLRLNRRLQTHGDAHLWEKIEGLSEEIETLGAERMLLENQV